MALALLFLVLHRDLKKLLNTIWGQGWGGLGLGSQMIGTVPVAALVSQFFKRLLRAFPFFLLILFDCSLSEFKGIAKHFDWQTHLPPSLKTLHFVQIAFVLSFRGHDLKAVLSFGPVNFPVHLEKVEQIFLQVVYQLLVHFDALFSLPDDCACDHFRLVAVDFSIKRNSVHLFQRLLEILEPLAGLVHLTFQPWVQP